MSDRLIDVLVVEDEPAHAEAVRRALAGARLPMTVRVASSLDEFRAAVAGRAPDLVLLDLLLPDGRADAALISPPESGPFPMVVMTSHGDEQVAVTAIRQGALDYVVKSPEAFANMPATVERTLRAWNVLQESRQAHDALRASEARFRGTLDSMMEGCQIVGFDWRYLYVNPVCARQGRITVEGLVGRTMQEAYPGIESTPLFAQLRECMNNRTAAELENEFVFPDGSRGWFQLLIQPVSEGLFVLSLDITRRKQAEEALAEEITRRRVLIEGSRDGIVIIDQDGGVFEANRQFAEMLGYTPEEVRDLHVWDWDRDWPRERVLEAIRGLGPEGAHFESRHWRKDGTCFVVDLSNSVAELGGRRLVFCVCHDISEAKRTEQALQAEKQRLASIIHGADVGTWEWNVQTGETVFNERWAGMIGYTLAELAPISIETWKRVTHPDDLKVCETLLDRHFRGELDYYEYEARLRHRNGRWIWVLDRGRVTSRTADGRPLMMQGTHTDITESKQAEAALRESEERFRQLVETTSDLIWEVDATGRYRYVSPRIVEILGVPAEDVVGHRPFEFMPPGEAERVEALFAGLAARGEVITNLESVVVHRDGRKFFLETSGVPVLDKQGVLTGYRGVDRDITARRQLEEQLWQAQKLEAVGLLAGGVAHDFNNILSSIMMQLGFLEMNPNLGPEGMQTVKDLVSEARRAAALTRQMLMFSRRSIMEAKLVDLNELIRNLLKMLGRLIGEHIRLTLDVSPGFLPSVMADAGMLDQVIMNLAVNARDAMPKGGRVTISTSTETFGPEAAAANPNRRPGRFVCMAVSDTGVGMDKETLQRIFEPFFTTKEPGRGTGLGLATVHGIVAQHKGWVEVASTPGQGTTFRIFIPAVDEAALPVVERRAEPPAPGGRETILIVEDEMAVRSALARALRALGYAVHEAANGQQAVALWRELASRVDLLLTDMVMPEGMTGLELAERLRSIKPDLKVIISSGYSKDIQRGGGITQTGIRYLPKPYPTRTLAETVRAALDGT